MVDSGKVGGTAAAAAVVTVLGRGGQLRINARLCISICMVAGK